MAVSENVYLISTEIGYKIMRFFDLYASFFWKRE